MNLSLRLGMLLTLVAVAAPAAAVDVGVEVPFAGLPLSSVSSALLPDAALDLDAARDLDAALPAVDPDVEPAPGLKSSRHFVILNVERRPLASAAPLEIPASLAPAADSGRPLMIRMGTVDVSPEPREMARDGAGAPPARVLADDVARAEVAAGLAASAAASLAAAFLAHLAVAMYHRIAPAQALTNGTRAAVHAEVARRGHASPGEVAAALGLHPKTARYHLDLLAGFQLLIRDADGAYRLPGAKREAEPTLDEAILELVGTRPGLNMTEVAREVGVSKSTAQERVTQLLVEGRLLSRRDERARLLFPAVPA